MPSRISPGWPFLIGVLLLLGAGAFLFYWFQLRPTYVYRACAAQASLDAKDLLKSKAEVAQDPALKEQYENLRAQDLYLRADYNSFLKKCLLHEGLPEFVQEGDA